MKLQTAAAVAIALTSLIWQLTAHAAPNGDWQLAMLQTPGPSQLKIEQRGRVFIYDGLRNTDVERAMDTQFDRIDRMMFVRTKVVTAEGHYVVEDDECD